MPRLLGVELKPWVIWSAAGVALVLVFLYLRARAGAGAQPEMGAPSFGAGATAPSAPASTVGATPSSDAASQFQQQLQQFQLEQAREQLSEQRTSFNLQQQYSQGQLEASLGLQKKLAALPFGGRNVKPNELYYTVQGGQLTLAQKSKESQSIFQQIGSGIQSVLGGIFQGATAAAPGITQAYIGSATGFYVPGAARTLPASTPPIAPSGGSRPPSSYQSQTPVYTGGTYFPVPGMTAI